jgi:hypothetical protein
MFLNTGAMILQYVPEKRGQEHLLILIAFQKSSKYICKSLQMRLFRIGGSYQLVDP